MESRNDSSTLYRGRTVVVNPSATSLGALTDAFFILEPTANPMYAVMLYEHPADRVTTCVSEAGAREAAMRQARDWIDTHLSKKQADSDDR